MSDEVIEKLLEKANIEIAQAIEWAKYYKGAEDHGNIAIHYIDQALALLRQQPPAGEWAKGVRRIVGVSESKAIELLHEACARFDAAKQEKAELKRILWDCHYLINTNNAHQASELIVERLNPDALKRR